ncbi:uncharacterized protein EDB93DRAFT_1139313 [Suillus bovinus]|uniref:uncharacterized protein n=1 Tax=Suillus bovinus TaxID=48563 RepID=UPI001B85DB46|nr:uncharacterized protein EDB93DRAFT_1139313 [Suillus bovinus]KAG2151143.1 hypothetical protein EDB93DRAFT_1139313 [Suillus bovinus]
MNPQKFENSPSKQPVAAKLENLLTANTGATPQEVWIFTRGNIAKLVSHRLLHTPVLPHILLPGKVEGVPTEFHQKAPVLCERLGNVNRNLLFQEPASDRSPADLEAVDTGAKENCGG